MSLGRTIKKLLIKISGNKFLQDFLYKRIKRLQNLTGVGPGGAVKSSGEFAIFKKLKKFPNSSYHIFDVGANKGDFASLALSYFNDNESFCIHCFEPSKTAFEKLSGNLDGNPNLVLNNIGLGKEKGEFDLFTDFPGSGTASLTKRNLDHLGVDFSQSEKVRIDKIDNYCSEKNIPYIDFLKIDVEGHELDVLHGAEKMFRNNNIKMVSFEFGGCNIDTRTFFRDFYYFFKEHNFQLYRVTPSGYLYPIPRYNEAYEQFRTTNFAAINKDYL